MPVEEEEKLIIEDDEGPTNLDDVLEEIEDTGKDVNEIKEEVFDTAKDVDEIKEDVDDIKEEVEAITKTQKSILKKVSEKVIPAEFNINDIAQQIVGAIILASPLAVTQEVWQLAMNLDAPRIAIIIGITLLFDVLLVYFTAYRKEKEKKIISIVPARILSMVLISYITAATMLYVFGVIGNEVTTVDWALRLIIFVGLFANVGAGTADIIR